ncbi:MAG: hypothetical protein NTW21_39135 [Verrucomicrobia bacterium]|nr:hypothetical protein [Verrucomicrobiota bacterium]
MILDPTALRPEARNHGLRQGAAATAHATARPPYLPGGSISTSAACNSWRAIWVEDLAAVGELVAEGIGQIVRDHGDAVPAALAKADVDAAAGAIEVFDAAEATGEGCAGLNMATR